MGILDNLKVLTGNPPKTEEPVTYQDLKTSKKVLIVEDEEALAHALELKFRSAGFEVITAENGEIGLELAVAHKPNIILLDLMMPVMNGKTMLRRLRDFAQFKNLPVVILTNAGDVNSMMETKTYYNAADFLIKSNVTPDQILERVKDLV